jgi:hypothetical protein
MGLILVKRFSGFDMCFALAASWSTSQGMPVVSASRIAAPRCSNCSSRILAWRFLRQPAERTKPPSVVEPIVTTVAACLGKRAIASSGRPERIGGGARFQTISNSSGREECVPVRRYITHVMVRPCTSSPNTSGGGRRRRPTAARDRRRPLVRHAGRLVAPAPDARARALTAVFPAAAPASSDRLAWRSARASACPRSNPGAAPDRSRPRSRVPTGSDSDTLGCQLVYIIPLGQRCSILELNDSKCHWPIGDPSSAEFFCGGRTIEGLPHCGYHSRIAYQPAADRRRDRRALRG